MTAGPQPDRPAPRVEDLLRPEAFPGPVREVEHVETHISDLFLTEERVYKVKKPIRNDFLDYSTADRRRHFCEEELRLNRRLSSEVYLRVAPLGRGPDGRWRVDPPGEAEDWAVEMRRLPRAGMLDEQLSHGELDEETVRALARHLAVFHASTPADEALARDARPEALIPRVLQNLSECRQEARRLLGRSDSPCPPPEELFDALERRGRSWWEGESDLLEQRVREGRIRDGHGDLHTGNICIEDGRFQIYDCVEFEPRFRHVDVGAEIAFLAMDLREHGRADLAEALVEESARCTEDPLLPRVVPLYRFHYALVRAKVSFLRMAGHGEAAFEGEDWREALRYLHGAALELVPAFVLCTCGLPASGKSWLARRIAPALDAEVLDSDVVRKRVFGLQPSERPDADLRARMYSPETSRRVYSVLLDGAVETVGTGHAAVVDATFARREHRQRAAEFLRPHGVRGVLLHVTATEEQHLARLERRRSQTLEASDADLEVYRKMRDSFEEPTEDEALPVVRADSREDPAVVLTRLLQSLLR